MTDDTAVETNNDNGGDDRMITLISLDNESVQIPLAAALHSDLIVGSLGLDDDELPEQFEAVNVPRVNGVCLKKVVEFLIHYAEHPMQEIRKPLEGNSLKEIITDKWYQDFVDTSNMDRRLLFEVLAAANYMNVDPLLDLACLWCTFELVGCNAEQIRVILNLPEMSPEEEAQAREEHPWIFADEE